MSLQVERTVSYERASVPKVSVWFLASFGVLLPTKYRNTKIATAVNTETNIKTYNLNGCILYTLRGKTKFERYIAIIFKFVLGSISHKSIKNLKLKLQLDSLKEKEQFRTKLNPSLR